MGLFSFFKKKKNKKNEELNKKYLAVSDKRYDENDFLELNEVYGVFKKYQGYEKVIDLTNGDVVRDKVNSLMSELVDLGVLCKNYDEFDDLYNNYKEFSLEKVTDLNILECMVLITSIQRGDYWFGAGSNVYWSYTKSGLIPRIIYKVISLYESRVKQV